MTVNWELSKTLNLFIIYHIFSGPVLQAALVPLHYPGFIEKAGLHINMYTSPAFISALIYSLLIAITITKFNEYIMINKDTEKLFHKSTSEVSSIFLQLIFLKLKIDLVLKRFSPFVQSVQILIQKFWAICHHLIELQYIQLYRYFLFVALCLAFMKRNLYFKYS